MPYAENIMPTALSNSRLWSFVQERPLVAAGIGLAIGAFLATLLPPTRTENQMLGGASDEVRRRARFAMKTEADHLKAVANRTGDAAREGAAHVADRAVAAAAEEGYPVGTLRAEHEQASEQRPVGETVRPGEASIRR